MSEFLVSLLGLSVCYAIGYWRGYRRGSGKLQEVLLDRDNAWQALDAVGVKGHRSKAAPRHNDGRSEVRRARWGSHPRWEK